ncbi:hypothetical protein EHS13_07030 [Paenibacillus psychroresistens]|uniref:SLH domain-containing protein n=1 Tax=Paenibacillus psychroresistens TaxID=1778678 RepID=A0A6B8RGZ3_9BACL|nr:cadherin-like beta sandwich domain-containing protein [Paenibacillus psychroresistens]QGQ94658.1 hypothetical protein EHS13_07030 [Paenibacillus psychroresistens]
MAYLELLELLEFFGLLNGFYKEIDILDTITGGETHNMLISIRKKLKKLLPVLLSIGLMLQMVPQEVSSASDVTAGVSNALLNFTYPAAKTKDIANGEQYYYAANSKAKVVFSSKSVGNDAAGSLYAKYMPVDFVLNDTNHKETLDWTEFFLSDTMSDTWNNNGKLLDFSSMDVTNGNKLVATGAAQANSNLGAKVTYKLLPDAPIMQIIVHLDNNGTSDYNGYLNYQFDNDVGQQLAYAPGLNFSPTSGGSPSKLFSSGWTGNYLYDGDNTETGVPAHGIAWYENEPTGLNAQGYISGVWFDASVKAGNSRDIVVYHITDYPSGGSQPYSKIADWAAKIPTLLSDEEEMATVTGTVYDSDGYGVKGVKVTARNISAQALNSATTDSQGEYTMMLPVGTYTLTGSRMAFSDSSNSVEIADINSSYKVNLYMEAIEVLASTGKQIPGGLSEGTANDIILENQKMALTVAKEFNDTQLPGATLGKPIDLAVQGGNDGLDWINLPLVSRDQPLIKDSWNILTVKNQSVEIVENSNIQSVVKTSGVVDDVYTPFPIETTYTIKPNEDWVYVESVITNSSNQPQTVWIGDAMDVDGSTNASYVPGIGVVSGNLDPIAGSKPSLPWIAMYNGDDPEAFGIMYEGDFAEGFSAMGFEQWLGSQKQVTIPANGNYKLQRYLVAANTNSFANKYEAVNAVYEELLKQKMGVETNLQLTPSGIITPGVEVTARVTVTNSSAESVDGLKASLRLSANLTTTKELEQMIGTIAPNSTVTVEWPLSSLEGGRGTASVDVKKQDNILSTQSKRIFIDGTGWYSGDNHSHSKWSDGSGTIHDNFTSARNKGLDFLTATDHNKIGQQNDVALENSDDFVALWGEEISTSGGHSLAYNINGLIDWNKPAQQYIDDTNASNNGQGIHYIAHPFYPGLEWDNWDVDNFTGIEVWNGFYPPKHPVNLQAVAKWDELNKQGRHIYGISNSDAHNPGKVGANYIRGYMPKLDKENIMDVLKNGTYYGTNGPHLTFNMNGKMMGQDVAVPHNGDSATLDFTGYSEQGLTTVRLIKNGDVVQTWTPNGNDIAEQLTVQVNSGDFFRMELEGNNGKYAYSNPIFIVEDNRNDDSTLKQLNLSAGNLNPVFNANSTEYTVNVGNSEKTITITPAVSNIKSSLVVMANGATVNTSSGAYGPISLNEGHNTITFEVTAENQTKKTYTVVVNREELVLSGDATLKQLTLSEGSLTPSFKRDVINYNANVANTVSSLAVTTLVYDENSSLIVKANGKVVSVVGGAYGPIGLNFGDNTLTLEVTAENQTKKTYTVVVNREVPIQSDDATLKQLTISEGSLTPSFKRDVINYNANVANSVSSLAVTALVYDENSSLIIKANGKVVTVGGGAYGPIGLNVGDNTLILEVTAENQTKKTYTVVVNREDLVLSDDATLKQLTISEGSLTPSFKRDVINYNANVANSVSSLAVTALVYDENSSLIIKANGKVVTVGGGAYGPIGLNVGDNTLILEVTAENQTKKTYTVVVNREDLVLSDDATLKQLTISEGSLTPTFKRDVINYNANVANTVSSLAVTALVYDVNSSLIVKANGKVVSVGGGAYGPIGLNVGDNIITFEVTAENQTKKTYRVVVNREVPIQSDDATLKQLTISEGTLTPSFKRDVINYNSNVANTVSSLAVTALVYDENSSLIVKANGKVVSVVGGAYGPIGLNVGDNTLTLEVTAENQTKKTYTVVVNRALSHDATLKQLQLDKGSIEFLADKLEYAVSVGNSVSKVTVTAAAYDTHAALEINDVAVSNKQIDLVEGINTIKVKVTAQDGTVQTYTLTITRVLSQIVTDKPVPVSTVPLSLKVPIEVVDARIQAAPTTNGNTKQATLPFVEASVDTSLGNVNVSFPSGVTISAPSTWDGTIKLPAVQANNSVFISNSNVSAVIEVGVADMTLTFDKAVRLLIPNQAYKSAGFVKEGVFASIDNTISADTQEAADADQKIAAGGEAKINVGNDLVIWTEHFTKFVSYTTNSPSNPPNPSSPSPVANKNLIAASVGGSLIINGVHITVPADAINTDITVTVDKVANTVDLAADAPYKLISDIFEIKKDKMNDFVKPVSIGLPFDVTKVDPAKSTISIYWFDETARKWVPLDNSNVDIKNAVVSGTVNHFTKFAVLAKAIQEPVKPVEPTPVPVVDLMDIKGHWAENSIHELIQLGAIEGYPDGTFGPEKNITRAEFAVVLVKAFKLAEKSGKAFTDSANHWAKKSIETAAAYGIITGYSETFFGPDDLITREQMAVMIVRAAKLSTAISTSSFTDISDISEWANAEVSTAIANDLMNGYENGTFKPRANATRAEAVTVILKAIRK